MTRPTRSARPRPARAPSVRGAAPAQRPAQHAAAPSSAAATGPSTADAAPRSSKRVQEAQRRTGSILASVADAHTRLDRRWRYLYANDAAIHAIGLPRGRVIGRTLWEVDPGIVGTELERQYRRAMRRRLASSFEFHDLTRDAWWQHRFSPVADGLAVFVTNTTGCRRAEAERDQLAAIIGTASDAIITTTLDGTIVSWNRGAAQVYGHDARAMIGSSITALLPAERADELATRVARLIRGEPIAPYESVGIRKDGSRIDLAVTVSPIEDVAGRIGIVCTMAHDITERKRAADELRESQQQLRALSAHLQTVREEERTRIAREIHDELGQVLTGLKMELSLLEAAWSRDAGRRTRARHQPDFRRLAHLVDGSIHTVRKIATELRPMILDSLGLSAAIEWQADEFLKASGIRCELSVPDEDFSPDRETATALFRILQESLTNIVRHAKAGRVAVRLSNDRRTAVLCVTDNGIGIGVGVGKAAPAELTSLGLLSMHERAVKLGGTFEVTPGPAGVGTTITARVPYRRAE